MSRTNIYMDHPFSQEVNVECAKILQSQNSPKEGVQCSTSSGSGSCAITHLPVDARQNAVHTVKVKSLRDLAMQSLEANMVRQNALYDIEVRKLRDKALPFQADASRQNAS